VCNVEADLDAAGGLGLSGDTVENSLLRGLSLEGGGGDLAEFTNSDGTSEEEVVDLTEHILIGSPCLALELIVTRMLREVDEGVALK
jgi:hypothetical protein